MKTMRLIALGLATLTLSLTARLASAQCPDTCTTDGVCSNDTTINCTSDAQCVGAAVAAACPCDSSKNHGQHQSCVVRLRNDLRKQGCPTAAIASCAARSTCGKPGAVLCCRVTGTGTCTGATDTTPGTCSNDATLSCATDADCTTLSQPRIRRTASSCTDIGGYVSGTGSVCSGCAAPVACCLPSTVAGQPGTCAVLSATDCEGQGGAATPGAAPSCSGVVCP